MAQSYMKQAFAISTALSLIIILFTSNNVFAESKVKNKIEINGVEYINEEVTTDGSIKTDIDVSVKNNQGSIKYKLNGEEKNIQISPNETDSRDSQDVKDYNLDDDEDSTLTKKADEPQEKIADKNKKEDESAGDLIEAMMKAMDNLFSRIGDLLS